MKTSVTIFALSASLLSFPVFAVTGQQNKMSACSKEASTKSLKGDDYKAFMKTCLSSDSPATALKKPTLGECSAKTKGMTKDEASKFKSACMKGG